MEERLSQVLGVKSISKTISRYMYLGIKRLFDLVCGIIGIFLLIPITIVIKIFSMLSGDFAPIIFSQNRIGKNGKEFKFYKFRSMVPNADEILFQLLENNKELAAEYRKNKKLRNDPRITRIGKFIRKTSLDEVPQLINVLKGDMSIIGNRPYLPREKKDMGKYYSDIVQSKPGITGYWQVSGRSKVSFRDRLKLESYYSKHMGLKLDVKIFFKTFHVVLFGKGAQ